MTRAAGNAAVTLALVVWLVLRVVGLPVRVVRRVMLGGHRTASNQDQAGGDA